MTPGTEGPSSQEKVDVPGDPLTAFARSMGDALRILAEGLKNRPYLALLAMILIIVAMVILGLALGTDDGPPLFLVLVFAIIAVGAAGFACYLELRRQQEDYGKRPTPSLEIMSDTFRLAAELTPPQRRDILRTLEGAALDTADLLDVPYDSVRSNLFALDGDRRLRLIPELTHNMDREEELTISLLPGHGSTGQCFVNRRPNIAVLREDWGDNVIPDKELRKLHPELRWVISVPVLSSGDPPTPIWVMNVDGLRIHRSIEELKEAVSHLTHWSEMIALVLAQPTTPRSIS